MQTGPAGTSTGAHNHHLSPASMKVTSGFEELMYVGNIPVKCSECGGKNPLKLFLSNVMFTLCFQSDLSMSMIERALVKLRRRKNMINDPPTIAPVRLNGYCASRHESLQFKCCRVKFSRSCLICGHCPKVIMACLQSLLSHGISIK